MIRRYDRRDGGLRLPPSLFELVRTSRLQPAGLGAEIETTLRQISEIALGRLCRMFSAETAN